jgi:hypothetical protein
MSQTVMIEHYATVFSTRNYALLKFQNHWDVILYASRFQITDAEAQEFLDYAASIGMSEAQLVENSSHYDDFKSVRYLYVSNFKSILDKFFLAHATPQMLNGVFQAVASEVEENTRARIQKEFRKALGL